MLIEGLQALGASTPITLVRQLPSLYGTVNGLHILGLATMFGSILTLDVRVLGLWRPEGWRDAVASQSPIAAAGLAVTVATGAILFLVRPLHYLGNGPFRLKMLLLAICVANVALFHRNLRPAVGSGPGLALRISAFCSLAGWTATVMAGRFIAFS